MKFIAPVYIHPGELEMEALLENGYLALTGETPVQIFVAAKNNRAAMDQIDELWAKRDWKFER